MGEKRKIYINKVYLFYMVTFSVITLFTLIYSLVFYKTGVVILSKYATVLAFAYSSYLVAAFYTKKLILLFSLSLLTLEITFFTYTFYTGGSYSPCIFGFIIPSLIPFFYKPYADRYFFIGLSFVLAISFFPITDFGLAKSLLVEEHRNVHGLLMFFLVFSAVYIYVLMFRSIIVRKNKILRQSLKELQDTTHKLIQSEKMASLGIMTAGVAHEINNPLNFIKGGVDGLSLKIKKTEDTKRFIDAIDEGVRRASSIVSSMSHFSRSTDSMMEACNLLEVVENCLVILEHKLRKKVQVIKKYDLFEPLIVLGNEGKLHQAMLNILSNAEQSIANQGEIIIESFERANSMGLKISDTGCGIKEKDLSKIRDPFFTTKPVGKGTGLGLSITYKILEEHGGKINVSSKLSQGTSFTIHFKKNMHLHEQA